MLRSLVTAARRCNATALQGARQYCDMFEGKTQKVERLEKTINQVMLLGRVGANPEMRGSETHPVVTFSLATHINYRKDNDLIQQTDWHRIAVFKPYLRDAVYRYMTKGQRVMVQGKLGYLERKDPNDNTVIKTATIVAEEVIFFNKSGQVDDVQVV
ncbi:Single-stranded DNA-binding protein, mitochondrial [Halocaridina rubra]|uniref:Single-stranded DNA-binding protein, mitochondrial n=1 Tax=Halocaridina rubra TaxID=373956 RepID=A0AAN8XFF3_HALRR